MGTPPADSMTASRCAASNRLGEDPRYRLSGFQDQSPGNKSTDCFPLFSCSQPFAGVRILTRNALTSEICPHRRDNSGDSRLAAAST
jgi:hypothetical protein